MIDTDTFLTTLGVVMDEFCKSRCRWSAVLARLALDRTEVLT